MGILPQRRLSLLLILLFLAVLSWVAREANEARFHYLPASGGAPAADWFSVDPDGLYHARRVTRSLAEGLPPAADDPRLNFPEGAAIPWPPYYDTLLTLLLKPFAPPDEAQIPHFVEQAAATLPQWWGVVSTLLLAAAAWRLAGRGAALLAGSLYALAQGSIHYSLPGVADHHAFVALLLASLLLVLGEALRHGAADHPRSGLRYGLASGLLAGILLGVWVAALQYLVVVQAMIGLLLLTEGKRGRAGLGAFGAAFHLAALLALLPALVFSPWQAVQPWVVVDLSWFHPAFLLLGAGFCLPLHLLRPGSPMRRRYPLGAGGVLLVVGLLLFLSPSGPGAGLREAFAWSARSNEFMADIAESQPLIGHDRYAPSGVLAQLYSGGVFLWLGYGLLLLPWAWWSAWRRLREQPALLPWLFVAPLFVLEALIQRRFSGIAALPLALLVGRWLSLRLRPAPLPRFALLLLLPLVLQAPTVTGSIDRLAHRAADRSSQEALRQNGVRWLHEWVAAHHQPGESVLAHWDQGHALEFVAGTGSVATNFGSYTGPESFRDAALFFTGSDPAAAEAILDRHRSRYVLVHSGITAAWGQLRAIVAPRAAPWRESLLAALLFAGSQAPPFLRLVAVSPFPDLSPPPRAAAGRPALPAGFLWERVPGARLVVTAPAGSTVEVRIPLSFADAGWSFTWSASTVADPGGSARLRVPYASGSAQLLRAGGIPLSFSIPEAVVREGHTLPLP